MESIGDQGTEQVGLTAVLGRAGSPADCRLTAAPQNVRPPWQTNPMESIGDQGTERNRSVVVLGRAGLPAGFRSRSVQHEASDGGARVMWPARHWLHAGTADAVPVTGTGPLVADFGKSAAESTRPGAAAPVTDIDVLRQALAVVNAAAMNAPDTLAMASYAEAADFAATAEEISRSVEYLQILGAGAVDRTRTQAITAAATARASRTSRTGRSWVTGWDNGT
ncbi:MAG TPA: hypothetical protein VD841_10500, partial [Arthrobacter sp.]|nr:hypothetical protein [Arthrobacter sp.]